MSRVEEKELLQDKMRAHAACSSDPDFIIDEQMPSVTQLANNHYNPINSHKDMVNSEWGRMKVTLAKDRVAWIPVMVPFVMGSMIGIV